MQKLKNVYFLFVLVLLLFFYFLKSSFALDNNKTTVIFFNVGQGDAALIQTPYNQDILIDAGPDKSVVEKIDRRLGFLNRDIELAVLTHNHSDHLKGFLELMNNGIKIEKLIYSNNTCEDDACREFYKIVQENKIEAIQARPGIKIDLFCLKNKPKCYGLDILGPVDKFAQDKNLNNTSVILKADLSDKDFIFTGDAVGKVWKYYYDNKVLPLPEGEAGGGAPRLYNIDILKVPHHGSKNGVSKELLELAKPQEAIISVGKDNRFGHPNSEAMQLLESAGVKIRRTDEEGDIVY